MKRKPSSERRVTIPRKLQVSLEQTRYYHCISRCVRRAYLCGRDDVSGRDYSHRRKWIEDRLVTLASIFAVDVVAYAIMHNHYHLVIRVMAEQAQTWTDDEVCRRWAQLFAVPKGSVDRVLITVWRERLASISWFMRCLNEPLARRANREDECTGRFWEGRFRLQALLDDTAVYKCMTYVDLNPVRAGIADTPEASMHTSIKARLEGRDRHLVPFRDSANCASMPLPLSGAEYIHLVRWSGRIMVSGKVGYIRDRQPRVLGRLNMNDREWIREIKHYGRWYYRAVGSLHAMERFCAGLGQQWLKGMSRSRPLLS